MRYVLLIAFLSGALLLASSAHATPERLEWTQELAASTQYPVTPSAAIASARIWAANPSLALEVVQLRRDVEEFQRANYQLTSPDGQEFEVNCFTGWVYHWVDRSAVAEYEQQLQDRALTPRIGLPEGEVIRLCTEFAQLRYPNYGALDLVRTSVSEDEAGFRSQLPTGVLYDGNWCIVSINQFTGRPLTYRAGQTGTYNGPVNPTVNAAQAENIAFGQFAGTAATAVTYAPTQLFATADPLGQSRLMWICKVAVSSDPNYVLPLNPDEDLGDVTVNDVWIDASSGSVIDVIQYLGGTGSKPTKKWHPARVRLAKKRASRYTNPFALGSAVIDGQKLERLSFPPVIQKGIVFWYVGYLRGPVWQMKVRRSANLTQIEGVNGQRIQLRDKVASIVVNGKVCKLSAAPFLLQGRVYLPLDAWEKITNDHFILGKSPARLVVNRSRLAQAPQNRM